MSTLAHHTRSKLCFTCNGTGIKPYDRDVPKPVYYETHWSYPLDYVGHGDVLSNREKYAANEKLRAKHEDATKPTRCGECSGIGIAKVEM